MGQLCIGASFQNSPIVQVPAYIPITHVRSIACGSQQSFFLLGKTETWGLTFFLFLFSNYKENCEEQGRMQNADPNCVSNRAKQRGLPQLGTLGAGNHYIEVQGINLKTTKFKKTN